MTDFGTQDKAIKCVWFQGTRTLPSNLLLYCFCQSTYINMNACDVINFSISTVASEAANATFLKRSCSFRVRGFGSLINDPALIKMHTDSIEIQSS